MAVMLLVLAVSPPVDAVPIYTYEPAPEADQVSPRLWEDIYEEVVPLDAGAGGNTFSSQGPWADGMALMGEPNGGRLEFPSEDLPRESAFEFNFAVGDGFQWDDSAWETDGGPSQIPAETGRAESAGREGACFIQCL